MITRAVKVAVIVGTLLAGRLPEHPWKIPLTYLVPFAVSLYSSAAERGRRADKEPDRENRC